MRCFATVAMQHGNIVCAFFVWPNSVEASENPVALQARVPLSQNTQKGNRDQGAVAELDDALLASSPAEEYVNTTASLMLNQVSEDEGHEVVDTELCDRKMEIQRLSRLLNHPV